MGGPEHAGRINANHWHHIKKPDVEIQRACKSLHEHGRRLAGNDAQLRGPKSRTRGVPALAGPPLKPMQRLNIMKTCQRDALAAGSPTQACAIAAYCESFYAAQSQAHRRSRQIACLATWALQDLSAATRPAADNNIHLVMTQGACKLAPALAEPLPKREKSEYSLKIARGTCAQRAPQSRPVLLLQVTIASFCPVHERAGAARELRVLLHGHCRTCRPKQGPLRISLCTTHDPGSLQAFTRSRRLAAIMVASFSGA